ncbi:hypothetical protein F2Q70_00005628 [Brassica cretica]|uniref:Uncharacterized protein n=1 Tax=Brassica cretica TaxID=69181 RepID=A0A8S9J4Y7_BRACR|nr:hypothetical protein F2Q70_00005628 [Brassica cretica]
MGVSAGDSTLGVVFAAAQRSRPVVPRRGGDTDEYMIFGRIGATELFIRIFYLGFGARFRPGLDPGWRLGDSVFYV